MTVSEVVHLAAGILVLLGVTYGVLRAGGVRAGFAPLVAIVRGAGQIALVGLALRGVLSAPPVVALALAVMLTVACRTAIGRLAGLAGAGRAVVLGCSAGAATSLTVVFGLQVLPLSARYVVALGGIVIGGTMTGATLAGRNLLHGLRREREVVEAWLSLGATPRQAVRDIARRATFEALVPALDQTRTTGLVTLPGAFVGALLGGADPLQAARFQLVVLGALLAAETVVASVVTYLLGAPARLPDPL
jgi:putative ABC transport system permease protein